MKGTIESQDADPLEDRLGFECHVAVKISRTYRICSVYTYLYMFMYIHGLYALVFVP